MNASALLRMALTFAAIALASGCESPSREATVEAVDVALGQPLDVAGWKGEGPTTFSFTDETTRHARGPLHLRLRLPSGRTVCETVRTLFVYERAGKVIGVAFWIMRDELPFAEALAEWHRLLTALGIGQDHHVLQRHAELQAEKPTLPGPYFGLFRVEPGVVVETTLRNLDDHWDVSIELRLASP